MVIITKKYYTLLIIRPSQYRQGLVSTKLTSSIDHIDTSKGAMKTSVVKSIDTSYYFCHHFQSSNSVVLHVLGKLVDKIIDLSPPARGDKSMDKIVTFHNLYYRLNLLIKFFFKK